MTANRLASVLVASMALSVVPGVLAFEVPGGGKKKSDCYSGYDVEATSNPQNAFPKGKRKIEQLACNGSCTFDVSLCTYIPVDGCTPATVSQFVPKKEPVPLPRPVVDGTNHVCGESATVTVPLKGARQNKKNKVVFNIVAEAAGAKPPKDPSKLVLLCKPNSANTGCGATQAECPANTAGGPDQVTVTVLGEGSDLDNGWTGVSHNFPVPSNTVVKACLAGCNGTDNPNCTVDGPTGQGSLNGRTLGPPLPLIAGGVPVCVVNRYNGPITGNVNVQTGDTNTTINIFADVFATDATRVCPRCQGSRCDSGPNVNQACTVEGTVRVAESLANNKNFELSSDCPPFGTPVGTLNIALPLTTGTSELAGPTPCREREAQGVPVRDDNCGAAGCGASCTGKACVSMGINPVDPDGPMVCIDSKGGISQVCCNSETTTPCFPTRGGGVITRTGRAVPPTPAWPDPTYPKTTTGTVTVATFCEAATTAFNIDSVAGLPGPGALIFTTSTEWIKAATQ